MGEEVATFEKQFAEFICALCQDGKQWVISYLLMIGSAIYNDSYKLNKGDYVIVPAVSWSTTYFPLQIRVLN